MTFLLLSDFNQEADGEIQSKLDRLNHIMSSQNWHHPDAIERRMYPSQCKLITSKYYWVHSFLKPKCLDEMEAGLHGMSVDT